MRLYRSDEPLLLLGGLHGVELVVEIEVIPADDGVLDEPVAGLGNFLLFFFALQEFTRAANSDGTREAVGELYPIELVFNCLTQGNIVEVAQNEQGLDDLAGGLQRANIKRAAWRSC